MCRFKVPKAAAILWAAAVQLDAHGGTIRKCAGLADADFNPLHLGKLLKQAIDDAFDEGLEQIDMCLGTFLDDSFAQKAIVKNRMNILVVDLFLYLDIELGINMQRLSGTKFVLEDSNTGIQGEL